MKKGTIIITFVWLIFTQTSLAQIPWVIDTSLHWTVLQACQDGYVNMAYAFGSDVLTGDGTPQFANIQTPSYTADLLASDFLDVVTLASYEEARLFEFGQLATEDFDGTIAANIVQALGMSVTLSVEERPHPHFASDGGGRMPMWYDIGIVEWDTMVDVGRFVAIQSTNSGRFIIARVANCTLPEIGHIERVSINENGDGGIKPSSMPSLSADGSRIAFTSIANNLDSFAFDENGFEDIYIHTQHTDSTRLISRIDGTSWVIAADAPSSEPDISFNGSQVVYTSAATNLEQVPACPVDGTISHVYLYDWTKTLFEPVTATVRVDIPAACTDVDGSTYRPTINQYENDIVMTTNSTVGDRVNLIDSPIFIDPPILIDPPIIVTLPPIIFPNATPTPTPLPLTLDNNSAADIVGDLFYASDPVILSITDTGTIAETGNGASDYADLSVGNEWVVFQTAADNFVPDFVDSNGATDIILRHTTGQTVTLVSVSSKGEQADADSFHPVISANSNQIAFESNATNLADDVPNGTTQIYIHSRTRGCTTLLSRSNGGDVGNGFSTFPTMSADGRFIAFTSTADNLVPNDTNGFADIFIVDRDADNDRRFFIEDSGTDCEHDLMHIRRVSVGLDGLNGEEANGDSTEPDFAADGAWLGFTSEADNLVEGDGNGAADLFVVFNGYPTQRVNIPLSINVHTTTASNHSALLAMTVGTILGTVISGTWWYARRIRSL